MGVLTAFGAEVEDGFCGNVELLGDLGAGVFLFLRAEHGDFFAEIIPLGAEGDVQFGGEGSAGAVAEGFDVVSAINLFCVGAEEAAIDLEFVADFFLGAVLQEHLLHFGSAGGGALELIQRWGFGEIQLPGEGLDVGDVFFAAD